MLLSESSFDFPTLTQDAQRCKSPSPTPGSRLVVTVHSKMQHLPQEANLETNVYCSSHRTLCFPNGITAVSHNQRQIKESRFKSCACRRTSPLFPTGVDRRPHSNCRKYPQSLLILSRQRGRKHYEYVPMKKVSTHECWNK
jgi:hypothetical protein